MTSLRSEGPKAAKPWIGVLTPLRPFMLIGEQFLYALANFAVTAMLARMLSVEHFAVYAAGYSLAMLLIALHQAVACEAVFVFPALSSPKPRRLWALISVGIFIVAVATAMVGFSIGGVGTMVAVGFAIFAPASVNQYARRRNQADGRYALALLAAIFYAVFVSGTTWALAGQDSPWLKMILPQVMGFLAAGAVNALSLRSGTAPFPATKESPPGLWKSVARFSLILGFNNLIGWLPSNIYQWILVLGNNPFEASAFRITQTMFVPYFQIMGAIGGPLSQYFNRNGFTRKALIGSGLLMLLPLAGSVCLLFVGSPLIGLIFGPKFDTLGPLAAFASLVAVPAFACSIMGCWLRGKHRAEILVVGTLANLVVLAAFGIPVAAGRGLFYVFGTMGAGYIAAFITMIVVDRIRSAKSPS